MIRVWTDRADVGALGRHDGRGSSFSYRPDIAPSCAVSLTMPVRVASYNVPFGLLPIFEMNLPEGMLRERLRLAFAKATGSFDDFDLLSVVGRSQVGRVRLTGLHEHLDMDVPFQSVDEILEQRRGGDLYRFLIEKFATFSGISGVQPKVLVRDNAASAALGPASEFHRQSHRGATHIVKFWEQHEYPQLAANECFCLTVAKKCGLDVPVFRLSDDGLALVVDRFDLRADGTYRGFEDFCVLNARRTEQKYRGSYESSVIGRFTQFANSRHLSDDLERLFTLLVVNCALRNGDAHLKNFGVVYDDVESEARLAPVYDLVTTSVYLPEDRMALTLNGTTRWPAAKELQRLGETRASITPSRVRAIFQRVSDAIAETSRELREYLASHPGFAEVGGRMLKEWDSGVSWSLRS